MASSTPRVEAHDRSNTRGEGGIFVFVSRVSVGKEAFDAGRDAHASPRSFSSAFSSAAAVSDSAAGSESGSLSAPASSNSSEVFPTLPWLSNPYSCARRNTHISLPCFVAVRRFCRSRRVPPEGLPKRRVQSLHGERGGRHTAAGPHAILLLLGAQDGRRARGERETKPSRGDTTRRPPPSGDRPIG